ncbi:preprotein translocase subunit YajC [Streptomyces sp. NPDC048604]|uniref:preprotein translocase subunit YajC n=1 Tax=Streptomyces sp. NPDC048604 TaxID=3365578 RepID=UPI00371E54FE
MLLPFIVLIGAMFLLTRSAKKKQQQAVEMRNQMQEGSGVRTIGGMYATVKEISEDTVLLEVAPGVHAVYAKNAIGAVLSDDEYNRIVHGETDGDDSDIKITADAVPDDVSSLTEKDDASDAKTDLTKKAEPAEAGAEAEVKDGKADGDTDAK